MAANDIQFHYVMAREARHVLEWSKGVPASWGLWKYRRCHEYVPFEHIGFCQTGTVLGDSEFGHVRYRNRYRHRNRDRMANFEVDTDSESDTDDSATVSRANNPQIGTEFCQLLQ